MTNPPDPDPLSELARSMIAAQRTDRTSLISQGASPASYRD